MAERGRTVCRRRRERRRPGPGGCAGLLIAVFAVLLYQFVSTPLVSIPAGVATSAGALDNGDAALQRDDVTSLAYQVVGEGDQDDVAIVGGGRHDPGTAREFGVERVVGLPASDARAALERRDDDVDIVQISLTGSAGDALSGIRSLEAAPLFTTEAWHTFLDRLRPGGMLSVTRWHSIGGHETREVLRAVTLAADVLVARGAVHPREHILVYAGPAGPDGNHLATLLVSPEPLDVPTVERANAAADRIGATALLTPWEAADTRLDRVTTRRGHREAAHVFGADLSPPTDDRPYFFQFADLGGAVRHGLPDHDPAFTPMWTLLAATLALIVAAGVGVPLACRACGHGRGSLLRPHVVYVAGAGAGLALTTHALLERVGVSLGRPSVALAAVAGALLVVGRVGGLLAAWLVDPRAPDRLVWPTEAAAMLAVGAAVALPRLAEATAGATASVQVVACVGVLAPVALVMGMTVPAGTAVVRATPGASVALLWGVAAVTAMVAWLAAVACGVLFGLTVTFAAGAVAYLVAACGMWWAIPAWADVDAARLGSSGVTAS